MIGAFGFVARFAGKSAWRASTKHQIGETRCMGFLIVGTLLLWVVMGILTIRNRRIERITFTKVFVKVRLNDYGELIFKIHNDTKYIISFVDVEVSGKSETAEIKRTFRISVFAEGYKRHPAYPFTTYKVRMDTHPFSTKTTLEAKTIAIKIVR